MATKLYVGNLSFKTTSDELREQFERAGNVESASVVEDRDTGRSRGFAFVEMATPEEAAAAIEQFNGKQVGGRALKVNEARPGGRAIRVNEAGSKERFRGQPIKTATATSRARTREGTHEPFIAPVVEERTVEGPEPIERTAYLKSQPIAVAYLDASKTEATVAWPLSENTCLADVVEACLGDFLPRYAGKNLNYTLEFWIDDHYYAFPLESDASTVMVLEKLDDIAMTESGSMRLLQIASEDAVVELLFDDNETPGPMRLAVLISVVRSSVLTRLFTRFHRNDIVRNDIRVGERLFAPKTPRISQTEQNYQTFLSPQNFFRSALQIWSKKWGPNIFFFRRGVIYGQL